MPALKEEERWNPRYGIGDVQVIGDGIADFRKSEDTGFYIDLGLCFLQESLPLFPSEEGDKIRAEKGLPEPTIKVGDIEKNTFSELRFSNNVEALADHGYSEEEAKEIAAAVTILCKHINKRIVGSIKEYE